MIGITQAVEYLKPGVNVVTMGAPYVDNGQFPAVKVPFFTKGSDRANEVRWYLPTKPTEYSTVEEQETKLSKNLTGIYNMFMDTSEINQEIQEQNFQSFSQFVDFMNSKLPKGFDKKELEIVAGYGEPYNGKRYVNIAYKWSMRQHLNGKKWYRVKGEGDELGWTEAFEENLRNGVPNKSVSIDNDSNQDDDDLDVI